MTVMLVTGGLGGLGGDVVRALLARGEAPRILTHRANATAPAGAALAVGDLRDGAGLEDALAGVGAIIHCASDPREEDFATEIQGATHLTRLAAAGGAHLIYISIIGAERENQPDPYPYYAAKRQAERIIEAGAAPWTILRAAQFHDLIYWLIQSWDDGSACLAVPSGMRFQSVARHEVAARLIALADAAPVGYAPPMRGPQTLTIEEMAMAYLTSHGRAGQVEADASYGGRFRVFRTGVNLLPDDAPATLGRETWAEYLHGLARRM